MRISKGWIALGAVVACSTPAVMMEAGLDATVDAGDAGADTFVQPADSGKDVELPDCGKPMDAGDAGKCDQPSKCTGDPPYDAAGCQGELGGKCGALYGLLLDCHRANTVCNPLTCKTDLAKTGTSIQQNCGSQQMSYDLCNQ